MTTFVKSQELKDVRRVCSRGMLLLFPFLILQLLELFVLPLDFFTFRVWEAALGTPFLYPGPFYPNIHIKKTRDTAIVIDLGTRAKFRQSRLNGLRMPQDGVIVRK